MELAEKLLQIEPQYVLKKYIRKTKIVKIGWKHFYRKKLQNNNIKAQIDLINKLDLLERKNLLSPELKRIIHIKLEDINHYFFNKNTNEEQQLLYKDSFRGNFVKSGAWDKNKKPIFPDFYKHSRAIGPIGFRTMYQLFVENIDYRETCEYQYLKPELSEEKARKKVENYRKVYYKIKNQGYKSQKKMGRKIRGSKIFDEIRIAIDRDGNFGYIASSGNHRLAIAKILDLNTIPVIVDGIHKKWIIDRSNTLDENILNRINTLLKKLDQSD